MLNLHRMQDRIQQWWKYPQPTLRQQQILGQYTDVIDTEFTARRLASEESARYIQEHMRTTRNFTTDYDLHHWVATSQRDLEGWILEFGVATGRTLNHFAHWMPDQLVVGFDGFEGLPENWTSCMPKGFFSRNSLPAVELNCELVVGWFNDTLPQFVKERMGASPISLLHIDSDLYSSAHTVLECLRRNIYPGTVIIFDEYINYPGWQQDEFRAWQEYCKKYRVKYDYIGLVSRHQQVAVRVTEVR